MKQMFCRLCLTSVPTENYNVIEEYTRDVLEVALPTLKFHDGQKQLICNTCWEKLYVGYQFKMVCLETDNVIFPYVDFENSDPGDLREMYMKEKGINISEDQKVCRLCMQLVREQFESVLEMDEDIFQSFIPEVNFSATKDPVICKTCVDALTVHTSFIKDCLDVEKNYKNFFVEEIMNRPLEVSPMELFIKCEENEMEEDNKIFKSEISVENIEEMDSDKNELVKTEEGEVKFNPVDVPHLDLCIKCEEQEDEEDSKIFKSEVWFGSTKVMDDSEEGLMKHEEGDIKLENIENESTQSSRRLDKTLETCGLSGKDEALEESTPPANKSLTEECFLNKKVSRRAEKATCQGNIKTDVADYDNIYTLDMFDCHLCSYKTKYLFEFKNHVQIHKNSPKICWYACDQCEYKSRHRTQCKRHMLIHKNPSEIQWYGCFMCDYKCKDKYYLKKHELIHKDPSQIEWYKCYMCDYKCKDKHYLKKHELIHKDPVELQWYQCDLCDHKTKTKSHLKRHMVVHKDASEVHWYQCDICDYKSKIKSNLNQHTVIHKDASEILWHKCDLCDYKSVRNDHLIKHMLTHKNSSEIQWNQCDVCSYKTRYLSNLNRHMLIHKNASEIPWYKCGMCDYKSIRKHQLSEHVVTHKNPSEIQWYECDVCDFKSKKKSYLRRHMLVHRDASEIEWHECDICHCKIKTKYYLRKHMLNHKKVETVV